MRAADLAKAIAYAERDDVRQAARALGHRIAQEHGLQYAAAAVARLGGSPVFETVSVK
jgi:sterol 3beta-glucosyltransferase